ncbi:hypothetical protein AAT17_12475 [Nonlabens sp. MIC269]|nr:hypothetical protein AAT17_12475 [Nonlabens sp. MIC269]
MRYFKDTYNRRLWHQSDEARELLDESQLLIIEHTIEYVDNELDVENDLSHVILWSEFTVINRLLRWLTELNTARSYASQSYSQIISAVLWAFKTHKPITSQTQSQFKISISLTQDFLKHDVVLRSHKDAQYLLMNIFIISERPDLMIRSFLKPMRAYHIPYEGSIFKTDLKRLTEYLFITKPVPNFLFPYLINCSKEEFDLIINIIEGKSLRKILPSSLKISKTENAILQNTKIELPDVEDNILERFVLAATILKEQPKQHFVLNKTLEASKIFRDQLATFKRDIEFWKSIFRFICKYQYEFEDDYNLAHLIDYFEAQRYYDEQPLQYSIKGRTLTSVQRAVDNWRITYTYNPEYLRYKWDPLPIEKWMSIDKTFSYVIEEITDGKRLLKESKTLHHCVFSYATSCYEGSTHVFSLSKLRNKIKKPFVTIEVRGTAIVQVAGKMNQEPNEKAIELIREWSEENDLNMNC